MSKGPSKADSMVPEARAHQYLFHEFGLAHIPEGKRLPTARYLAQQAGVSTKTICTVLSALENQGLITITKGGTYRGQKPNQSLMEKKIPARVPRKGEKILAQMRDDIRSGRFTEGEVLPDMGKLSEIYNVSRPTLLKSLSILVQEDVLVRHLTSFMVPRPKRIFPSAAVLVICTQTLSGSPALSGQRALQFLSRMQWECRERLLHLEVSSFGEHEDAQFFPRRMNLIHHRAAFIGYVLLGTYMGNTGISRVLKELAPHKRPIAIIDEMGGLTLPPEYRNRKDIQIFTITDFGAGLDVAKMLVKANHTQVAWFSPYHSHSWSRERLRGLQFGFENENNQRRVIAFTYEGFSDVLHFAYALFDDDPEAFEAIEKHISKFYAPLIMEYFRKVCANKPWAHVNPERLDPLRKTMRYIADSVTAKIPVSDFTAVKDLIYGRCAVEACGVFLEPAFNQALSQKECTAWVCCNDEIAHLAIRHLEALKIPHPQRPSIIGFDNNDLAYEWSISSYDFNFSGLAATLLRFILDPKGFAQTGVTESQTGPNFSKNNRPNDSSQQRLPGFIVERFSTRIIKRP